MQDKRDGCAKALACVCVRCSHASFAWSLPQQLLEVGADSEISAAI